MHMFTIEATDAVTGKQLTINFPAVTELMARAWAELCHENNEWAITTLRDNEGHAIEEWV